MKIARSCVVLFILTLSNAMAAGGPLGIDHQLAFDNSGIWKRSNQIALLGLMVAGEVGGALWEGGENRLGRTLWQSVDATLAAGGSAYALKGLTSRERPSVTSDPNKFFSGHGNQSFPSGEVSAVSAIITPLVLEYGDDHPGAYLLEALPVYDGIARMKVRGHWQTDVLAGFALGTASGYWAHSREKPFVLNMLPNGIMVGYHARW